MRRRHNSLDDEIRDLSRKIGSGSFTEADVLRLRAAMRRRQGEPLPRIIQVAIDMENRNWSWGWDEIVEFAKATYDKRFTGRSPGDVASTVIGTVADDIVSFIMAVLSPPEGQGLRHGYVLPSRRQFAEDLEQQIRQRLLGSYGSQLREEIQAHVEGLGGLALPDLARHVLSRYRAHEEEGLAEEPGLLRELALDTAEDIATTRKSREDLADRIVEAVEQLRDGGA